MSEQTMACYLYERDGTLLAVGNCRLACAPHAHGTLTTVLDRPGRVIQRCLLGEVHEAWLQLRDGALLPVHVERVFFDPECGRTCVLRVEDARRAPVTANLGGAVPSSP